MTTPTTPHRSAGARDWTRPAIDLIDEVTDELVDTWEARNGRTVTDATFARLAAAADAHVMARLA